MSDIDSTEFANLPDFGAPYFSNDQYKKPYVEKVSQRPLQAYPGKTPNFRAPKVVSTAPNRRLPSYQVNESYRPSDQHYHHEDTDDLSRYPDKGSGSIYKSYASDEHLNKHRYESKTVYQAAVCCDESSNSIVPMNHPYVRECSIDQDRKTHATVSASGQARRGPPPHGSTGNWDNKAIAPYNTAMSQNDPYFSMAIRPYIPSEPVHMSESVMSSIQSKSLLTCNSDFRRTYPCIFAGLCKGLIDVSQLLRQEVIIPVKRELTVQKSMLRSRRNIVAMLSDNIGKSILGQFPDPQVLPQLIKKLANHFYDVIESGIKEAEDERSLMQWLLRFDVENAINFQQSTSVANGPNVTYAHAEGCAHIVRKKGEFLSVVKIDSVKIDMDFVMKVIFLNGGQLREIDKDPQFVQLVQQSHNMLAQNLLS